MSLPNQSPKDLSEVKEIPPVIAKGNRSKLHILKGAGTDLDGRTRFVTRCNHVLKTAQPVMTLRELVFEKDRCLLCGPYEDFITVAEAQG